MNKEQNEFLEFIFFPLTNELNPLLQQFNLCFNQEIKSNSENLIENDSFREFIIPLVKQLNKDKLENLLIKINVLYRSQYKFSQKLDSVKQLLRVCFNELGNDKLTHMMCSFLKSLILDEIINKKEILIKSYADNFMNNFTS